MKAAELNNVETESKPENEESVKSRLDFAFPRRISLKRFILVNKQRIYSWIKMVYQPMKTRHTSMTFEKIYASANHFAERKSNSWYNKAQVFLQNNKSDINEPFWIE